MIYLKRFLFCIALIIIAVIVFTISFIVVIAFPLWGMIFFVLTGEDPLAIDIWDLIPDKAINTVDWFISKFLGNTPVA